MVGFLKAYLFGAIVLLSFDNSFGDSCVTKKTSTNKWDTGAAGTVEVTFPTDVTSWSITFTFEDEITELQVWQGTNIACSGTTCTFDNESWNSDMSAGQTLDIAYLFYYDSPTDITAVSIDGVCDFELASCNPGWSDWGCCTPESPCDVDEGDCDADDECSGDLVCGTNNCETEFGEADADCCEEA